MNKNSRVKISFAKKYERVFGGPDMPFLVSDIVTDIYTSKYGFVTIYKNSVWTSYMPLEEKNKTLAEGVELYKNKENFEEFRNEYMDFINTYDKRFREIIKRNKNITKEIFVSLVDLFKKAESYYAHTQYFYTDGISQKNKEFEIEFGILKEKGRKLLNKQYFSDDSYINKILEAVSNVTAVKKNELYNCTWRDICLLLENKKSGKKIKKLKAYITYRENESKSTALNNEALEIIDRFLLSHEKSGDKLSGTIANKGNVVGKAYVIDRGYNHKGIARFIDEMEKGSVLITETTSPEIITVCKKASAIVTNQGGLMSHAAIVSRELNIPCIVGVKGATVIIKNGDLVEVDANEGVVKILDRVREIKINLEIGKISDYQQMFKWQNPLPYLVTSLFLGCYKKLDVLVLSDSKLWISYLPLSKVEKTYQDGFEIYSNNKIFEKYKYDFEKYIKNSEKFFKGVVGNRDLDKNQVEEFLIRVTELFSYYSKTEFFYTEKAYLEQENHPTIKENFTKFEQMKIDGRKYLNKIFFEKDAFLLQLMDKLSQKFKVSPDFLLTYNYHEILGLFEGKNVDKKIITQRKRAYISKGNKSEVASYCGTEAKKVILDFNSVQIKNGNILKGQIACKGYVKGRARVFKFGLDDFHLLKDLIDSMKKGEVLVAETTSPEIMMACKKACAIVTNQGGMMSHAAIISREMNIPCIVGTKVATDLIKNGDLVEVDAESGIVRILK